MRPSSVTRVILALVLVVGLSACSRYGGQGGSSQYAEPGRTISTPAPAGSPPVAGGPTFGGTDSGNPAAPENQTGDQPSGVDLSKSLQRGDNSRLVIRDKTLQLRVAKAEVAVASARRLVARFGGTVEQIVLATPDGPPIYRPNTQSSVAPVPLGGFITLRVPVARFEAFVAEASRIGRVVSESESSQDVTEQHVDLEARLRNLQAEAARLRALFVKARTVTEMLRVEAQLSRVQGEIESMQAQITFLERQAAMATVTLELLEPTPITQSNEDWGFRQALHDSLLAFVSTINGLIVFVGGALPLLVLALGLTWLVVVVVRRRRPRRQTPEPDAESRP